MSGKADRTAGEKGDLLKAKALLAQGGIGVALCKGDSEVTMALRGIAPLLELIESGVPYDGYSAADKIVGKAAALLFASMRVRAVYGAVMSRGALSVLRREGIAASFGVLADTIVNRAGDGACPMELAVRDVEEPASAYAVLQKALCTLRKQEKDTERATEEKKG